jgi:hypothetical protein
MVGQVNNLADVIALQVSHLMLLGQTMGKPLGECGVIKMTGN